MTTKPSFDELSTARRAFEDATDPAERARLSTELDVLRAQLANATRHGLADLDDDRLQRRIATVRSELERAGAGRISGTYAQGTSMGMGGGGGLDPVKVLEHNAKVDEQTGRDALLGELDGLLAEQRSRAGDTTTPNRRAAVVLLVAAVAALAAVGGWLLATDDDPPLQAATPLVIESAVSVGAPGIWITYPYPCGARIEEPVTIETSTAVTITLTLDSRQPSFDPSQSTSFCENSEFIFLAAPLGERQVIDGSSGREVPVTDRR